MFNLQMDAGKIADGICSDLDMDMRKIGIAITDFNIESFSYPEAIKKMQEKAAAQSMVGDMNKYQQMAMANSLEKGRMGGSNVAGDMVSIQMGMAMGQQMVQQGTRSTSQLLTAMKASLESEPLARIDYVEAVSMDTIQPIDTIQGQVLVAMAVFIGKTRLIDNFIVEV
jgi:membrane protease subunit (stomatin/prohibitin family)